MSELYHPEETSSGYFVTHIAEGLAHDFDVRAIVGQPSYSQRGRRAPRHEIRAGVRITRVRASTFDKDRLILRVINLVTFSLAAFFRALLRVRRGDRILVVTNPPTLPLLIALVARLRGARPALLVHDIYPEVLGATGTLRHDSLAYRALQRLFDTSFRAFHDVIVLGPDMAEVVARKMGPRAGRIVEIPNWADVDEIVPATSPATAFAARHGLAGKTIIQYSGNIGRTHDLELLLDAAAQLHDREDVVFLVIGDGGKMEMLRRNPAGNIVLLPRQPRDQLGMMLTTSTATLISFVDGMFGISVPSRMYNVMAAGVPIIAIADPRSTLATTVTQDGSGWVLPHDATALAGLVRSLATPDGADAARRRGAAGRIAAERKYALPHVLTRFRALFAGGLTVAGHTATKPIHR